MSEPALDLFFDLWLDSVSLVHRGYFNFKLIIMALESGDSLEETQFEIPIDRETLEALDVCEPIEDADVPASFQNERRLFLLGAAGLLGSSCLPIGERSPNSSSGQIIRPPQRQIERAGSTEWKMLQATDFKNWL